MVTNGLCVVSVVLLLDLSSLFNIVDHNILLKLKVLHCNGSIPIYLIN